MKNAFDIFGDILACIACLAIGFAYGFKAGRDSMASEILKADEDLKQSSDALKQSVDNATKPTTSKEK